MTSGESFSEQKAKFGLRYRKHVSTFFDQVIKETECFSSAFLGVAEISN
jgi:hypothetical protein